VTRGQRGGEMSAFMTRMAASAAPDVCDWTDRIAAGECGGASRPRGVERNVVITMWGWGDEVRLIHDEIASTDGSARQPNGSCTPSIGRTTGCSSPIR